MRAVQDLRKKAGLQKSDIIELYASAPAKSQAALEANAKEIKEKVGAKEVNFVAAKVVEARKTHASIKVRGFEAQFGF